MKPLAEAAAFLAQQWPVFPCRADKKPATEHGFKDAVRDPDRARAMFRARGAENIGVPTGIDSGIVAVDLDVKHGAAGLEWLAANTHRLPPTRRHATRSGGVHLLFIYPAGRNIRNSQSGIAPGVDVRGEGGYIIAPPSPGYSITDDAMPADMPAWLLELLDPPQIAPPPRPIVSRAPLSTDGTPYGLAALERECAAVAQAMPGTQETTLNAAGLKLGALIAGGELSRGVVLQSLIAAGNQMVTGVGERPWTPEEIRAKVHRAVTDGGATPRQAPPREVRHTIRVEIVPPEAPPRDEAPDYWAAEPEPEIPDQNPTGAHLRAGAPLGLLPIIDFDDVAPNLNTADFVEGLLIEGAMSVVYGPSNCGKTFFATDLGLHVAAGWEWRGRAVEQGAVAYCALEGSHGISNRVAAFKAHHGVVGGVPFFIIPVSINLLDPAADRDRLVETVKAKAAEKGVTFRLIVIDTLSRAMAGGNENAPDDMGALVSNADYVRQALPAHTMFIHHSGKDQAQGARGHSLLRAATDTEIEISRENTEAPSVARVTKQRELEIDGEFVFKLEPVELGINQRGKPVTSCIVATVDGPAPTRKPRLSSAAEAGLTALREALAKAGQTGQHRDIPRDIPAVPLENWRFEFHARSPAETPEARKKAFQRAQRDLLETKVAVVLHGMAWIVEGALHD